VFPVQFKRRRRLTIHKVKSWTYLFEAVLAGGKTHDIRYMRERDYKVGDTMILQETDVGGQNYTGRELPVEITYITSKDNYCALSNEALMPEYCIISFKKLPVIE
jgi:hypothetical protein